MSYTNVFGGNTIYPSDVSYLALALDADTALEWPLENSGTLPPAARIIDVTPDAAGWAVTLPDATLTGAGQVILFNNLSGSDSFLVKDYAGNTLATVGFGEQWELYLAATTTAAGTWRVFRFGASTAGVQPSSLAGFGLTVTGSTLSQAAPVTTFNTTGLNVASSNRASAFVWEGTGAGTINLPTAVGVGNNFFIFVRNEGGGDLTVEPAGTEVINGAVNLALRPGDSATVITDGVKWYTIGLGQEAVFAFDYTSITVTGGNYSLAGSELNRIAYKFVGTLTSDVYIIVPSTIQQYWINNQTTGAFNFFIKTLTGPATQINQGAKGIYYCDGLNMVLGSDPTTLTTPIVVSDGGTGAVTASGARLNLGITAFADPIVTATSGATVRTVIGAASSGVNNDISELTGLTTPLSVAQGGTGSTTASGARTNLGLGTMATQNANNIAITGGSVSGITDLAIADGGTGASDATGARTNLGLGSLAVLSSINNSNWSGTVLAVANGGTGSNTAADARTALDVPSRAGSGATGTWPISITGTANALNTGNSYTVNGITSTTSGLASSGDFATPNNGTTGGIRVRGNATSGFGRIQFTDASATAEWANLNVNSAGLMTYSGSITASGNVTAYSDARLKTNLVRIDRALDKLETLTGYTYTRTDSGERQTGLIAQDVQKILPEAVTEGEYLSVAYGNMMGLVVEAIKELRAEVAELRQQAVKVIK